MCPLEVFCKVPEKQGLTNSLLAMSKRHKPAVIKKNQIKKKSNLLWSQEAMTVYRMDDWFSVCPLSRPRQQLSRLWMHDNPDFSENLILN